MASLERLLDQYSIGRDPIIREKIILECVGLVKHIVGRLPFVDLPGAEFDDLVGHGILGLISALDRFDLGKGVKFETFASTRIKGAIIDALRKQNWLPRDLPRKMRMIEAARSKLEASLLRHPTDEEMACELGLSAKEYETLMSDVGKAAIVSLDGFVRVERNGDTIPLSDMLDDDGEAGPEKTLDIVESKKLLAQAIDNLDDREKLVLSLYYFEELTLKEIGSALGVSESRVCQIHTKALFHLRMRLAAVRDLMAVS